MMGRTATVILAIVLTSCASPEAPEAVLTHAEHLELRRLRPVPEDRVRARLPGTAPEERRRRIEYLRTHPETPRDIARMILRGEIEIGMHKHEVAASWGPEVLEANGPGGVTVGAGGFERWSNAYAGLILEFVRYGLLWHIEVAPPEWAGTPARVAVILPREE